jgi:hypothetical protein
MRGNMPPPWIPRDAVFWRYHLGALVFVVGITLGSGLVYGSLDAFSLTNSLLWTGPYTAAVLGFRGLVLRRGWQQRGMRSLVPVVLGYSVVSGFAVIAVLSALVLPFFWQEIAARQGASFAAGPFLLRSIVGNGLQTQLFIAAWAFVYLSALNADRARDAELLNLRLSHSLKEAQLSHLANQLNPHFLFNALNNIRFMLHEDAARADHHLVTLSDILRYTLSSSRVDKARLAPELDAVRGYVALMQGQLEQRLRFELDAPPALGDCLIPPMLLAMLVENGVKHGLELLPQGGLLAVRLWAEGTQLRARVSNDHPTTARAQPDASLGIGIGIGLNNISERLTLLYGASASLTTTQAEGRFVVDLSLPLERAR